MDPHLFSSLDQHFIFAVGMTLGQVSAKITLNKWISKFTSLAYITIKNGSLSQRTVAVEMAKVMLLPYEMNRWTFDYAENLFLWQLKVKK